MKLRHTEVIEPGFYIIDAESPKEIKISTSESGEVVFFDETSTCDILCRTIILQKKSKLSLYGFTQELADYKVELIHQDEGVVSEVRYLLVSRDHAVKTKIASLMRASSSSSHVSIVAMALSSGHIDVDGVIDIGEGIKGVQWYVREENVFLWDSGKIRGVPTLIVHSDDVKAGHSCKIERISDEKLFYLRSRGVNAKDATALLIESLIVKCLEGLQWSDPPFYEALRKEITDSILGSS